MATRGFGLTQLWCFLLCAAGRACAVTNHDLLSFRAGQDRAFPSFRLFPAIGSVGDLVFIAGGNSVASGNFPAGGGVPTDGVDVFQGGSRIATSNLSIAVSLTSGVGVPSEGAFVLAGGKSGPGLVRTGAVQMCRATPPFACSVIANMANPRSTAATAFLNGLFLTGGGEVGGTSFSDTALVNVSSGGIDQSTQLSATAAYGSFCTLEHSSTGIQSAIFGHSNGNFDRFTSKNERLVSEGMLMATIGGARSDCAISGPRAFFAGQDGRIAIIDADANFAVTSTSITPRPSTRIAVMSILGFIIFEAGGTNRWAMRDTDASATLQFSGPRTGLHATATVDSNGVAYIMHGAYQAPLIVELATPPDTKLLWDPVFVDDFETCIPGASPPNANWVMKSGLSSTFAECADLENVGAGSTINRRAMFFAGNRGGGDVFSVPVPPSSSAAYRVRFRYAGIATNASVPNEYGGFLGATIWRNTDSGGTSPVQNWLFSSSAAYNDGRMFHLIDDGTWRDYEFVLDWNASFAGRTNGSQGMSLMLEDWGGGIGGPVPFDAFFDDFQIETSRVAYCGDGVCDEVIGETCIACAPDCVCARISASSTAESSGLDVAVLLMISVGVVLFFAVLFALGWLILSLRRRRLQDENMRAVGLEELYKSENLGSESGKISQQSNLGLHSTLTGVDDPSNHDYLGIFEDDVGVGDGSHEYASAVPISTNGDAKTGGEEIYGDTRKEGLRQRGRRKTTFTALETYCVPRKTRDTLRGPQSLPAPKELVDAVYNAFQSDEPPFLLETERESTGKKGPQTAGANVHFAEPKVALKKKLGSGAFGEVFLGELRLNTGETKRVAVKRINEKGAQRHLSSKYINAVAEFQNELEIMRALPPHKNCVPFVGYGMLDEKLALFVEYLPMGSLKFYLPHAGGSLSPEKLTGMCLSVAQGMSHLHDHGIVHRDLAARNVLMNELLDLVICDYGLARFGSGPQDPRFAASPVGPLRWWPAEAITGGEISFAVDCYSWAMICIEIFSNGGDPWPELTPREAARAVALDKKVHVIPELMHKTDMGELVSRCMEFDPLSRPSASEIVEKLSNMA